MIDAPAFVAHLQRRGVSLFTGVPDSLLKDLGVAVTARVPAGHHVIAANEGAAVGVAIGHYLRTAQPAVVYLQNSGLGNAVNPLMSLADPEVYGIPMLLIVGWRGRPGVTDEPQHRKQGRIMPALLDALDLPWQVLPHDTEAACRSVDAMLTAALASSSPSVLLVEPGGFASTPQPGPTTAIDAALPSREAALTTVVEAIGDEAILVATTGMLSRELFALRQRTGAGDERDFLTVGGMGHASAIALGVALEEADREVWCLDGDGALLMHLGGLAVIAEHAPHTLFHVVFNNGVHASVGGQPTAISQVDLVQASRGLGYRNAVSASNLAQVAAAVPALRASGGPSLLEAVVQPGNRAGIGRPTRSPAQSRQAFMQALR